MRYTGTAFVQDTYVISRIYISVPAGKKDTKYLIKKYMNQSTCMNAEIERGRGGHVIFPQTEI